MESVCYSKSDITTKIFNLLNATMMEFLSADIFRSGSSGSQSFFYLLLDVFENLGVLDGWSDLWRQNKPRVKMQSKMCDTRWYLRPSDTNINTNNLTS